MRRFSVLLFSILFIAAGLHCTGSSRMDWWRDARFGMFLHWGLYSIPGGEWKGEDQHAEWIRETAHIPLKTYEAFLKDFSPDRFDADAWVKSAKAAGMKYIVLTAKHHDGFCLFDSEYTDFDVMSTPFKRDIMKEVAEACHRHGMKIGWYYSIMDWHHPDYLPKREWENDPSEKTANFEKYVKYMMLQLQELLTHYGEIDILWFDGEWEKYWNREWGKRIYEWVLKLSPNTLVNNRVGVGRQGMEGLTPFGEFGGDFGTPEQTIPPKALPDTDWESCITMNDHWGWNKADNAWKKPEKLIYILSSVASRGGNLLLNVGPKPDGTLPESALKRLAVMGKWMDLYSESIYGTQASPFENLPWGNCTQKRMGQLSRLYLHIHKWPEDGVLVLPGLYNKVENCMLLNDKDWALSVKRDEANLRILLPKEGYDPICAEVILDIWGKPDVNKPPEFKAEFDIFSDQMNVWLETDRKNVEIRYNMDGANPTAVSSVYGKGLRLSETTLISARCFRNGRPVSDVVRRNFRKVKPIPAMEVVKVKPGLNYTYYEGTWKKWPKFSELTPLRRGLVKEITLVPRKKDEQIGFQYWGLIKVPKTGIYELSLGADDGSVLYIGSEMMMENASEKGGYSAQKQIALEKGFHPFRLEYVNDGGKLDVFLKWRGPGMKSEVISSKFLYHSSK